MLFLSGCVRPFDDLPSSVGWMMTPMMGNNPKDGRVWAADNGCFAQPKKFRLDGYLDWLAKRTPERCLFATAPDVVGDAGATWERSRDVLPMLRALGFPAALVAQDGLTVEACPWGTFDALFMGGSNRFKLSETAYALMVEAKARGHWVHAGRVNSWLRFRAMAAAGADSVDGTFLAFGPDKNLPRLRRWLDWQGHVGQLDLLAGAG